MIDSSDDITIAARFVAQTTPSLREEEWIGANVTAIDKIGAAAWLALLLHVLQGERVTSLR